MLDDSLVREATFANTTDFIIDDVRQRILDIEMGPVTNEMTTRMFDNAESSTAQTEQAIAEVLSSVEHVIHMEDASDDEDVSDAQVKVENPIFLITIEDGSTHSTEARVEEPQLMEDPPVASSPSAVVVKAPSLHALLYIPPHQHDVSARSMTDRHFVEASVLHNGVC
jgi:hypothetical protein